MPRAKAARMWADRRLAGRRVERGQLHGNLRARGIEERFDRTPRAGPIVGSSGKPPASTAVPCRSVWMPVIGERKLPALLPEETRQRAPHVAVPDQCQLH
jgi:hypothetical protein